MSFTISQQVIDDLAAENFTLKISSSSNTDPDNATTVTGGQVISGGYHYLFLVADSGYGFLSGNVSIGSFDRDFSFGNPPTYGRALVNGGDSGTVEIVAESLVYTPPADLSYNFLVSPSHLEIFSSSSAKLQVEGVDAEIYTPVYSGDILTAICIGDFEFYEEQYYPYVSMVLTARDSNNFSIERGFTLGDPPNTATLETQNENRAVSFVVGTVQVTPEIVGANNVYLIDSEILNEVNIKRFQNVNVGNEPERVDYGTYILSVLQIPTTINEDYVIASTDIQLGDYDTGVSAPQLSLDALPFDMGVISVPETFNNSLDFQNTICNLHLPWAQSVAIEAFYVVGQDLSIEYILDCYTGNVTINISSTKTDGEVFHTLETSLGVNVPYSATVGYTPTLNNSNVDVGGNNHILKPFIEVIRNDAPLASGVFSASIVDDGVLTGVNGFVVVQEIELDFKALRNEKNEIENILSGGVIIK
jgi:hypothetical protein